LQNVFSTEKIYNLDMHNISTFTMYSVLDTKERFLCIPSQ